ncbi:type II secretion system protein GspL [Mycetohabitans sp. B46]|uniref:type II secretion system protein GspL n=1 Tax=Mycetohabitans sp. B46 TaxID=2772536 RepID=UPI00307DE1B1
MTTLIVQLPPRDPAVPSQEWQLPDLPFLLLDKRGRTQRAGRASLALLPRATRTVLMLAARDLLMLAATVPPLNGPRLRQALPNVIEDHLIQDPQTCHIALDPAGPIDGKRVIAAIDRGWFRFICDAFRSAGHTSLRAVPVTRCLPQPGAVQHALDALDSQAAAGAALPRAAADGGGADPSNAEAGDETGVPAHLPIVAAILGDVVRTQPAALLGEPGELAGALGPHWELALARGALGEGFAVPVDALEPTLAALAADAPVTLYRLTGVPGSEPHAGRGGNDATAPASHIEALPLTFETLARNALAQDFDLCQFEFAPQLWNLSGATLARWRLPIALALASIVVAVIGVNVQWLMLARQRDAINAQMTELLLSAFPKTTVVLDPADQMTRQLDQLRLAAGEPAPDDFLSLADALARSLGPVPSNTIVQLDYRNRSLEVTFKPSVVVDNGLTQRLARNGVAGEMDTSTGKWTIRSAR